MRHFRKLRVFAIALLMPVLLPLLVIGLVLQGTKKSSKETLEPEQLMQEF
jgi:hypothetical protein